MKSYYQPFKEGPNEISTFDFINWHSIKKFYNEPPMKTSQKVKKFMYIVYLVPLAFRIWSWCTNFCWRRLWEQFNILNMNLCLAMAGGHFCMLLGQLEVIQEDRHACTAVGKHWALDMVGGHLCMLLGQLEVIQEDRHACTAVGKHWAL
jgi:hypothetical protein